MARNTDTLLAFVLGAAVGGITALLLAPDKGEVTRRRLRDGSRQVVRRGKDAVTAVEEAAREKTQGVTQAARQQAGAVREAVTEAKEAYRREMEKG